MTTTPILKVKNVQKYYGNDKNVTKAVHNITFDINEGEFVGIMGASGSGKTTILNCIATIDHLTSGNIWLRERSITDLKERELAKFRREKLGFIFQDFNLVDTLTVRENIALALTILKISPKVIDEKVEKVAKTLGIEATLDKFPNQISGGQKQRAASARAIVTEPDLILADEPTGALDSKSARTFMETLTFLNQDLNKTILMVTHDTFSASYAKRIMFIKDGKMFKELIKGQSETRRQFFDRIIEVVTLLGGDQHDVI
ncbi:MAG: ABC transporter ATP-binding protein [Turicibacter sp.]|nr:ABC transporter ATP-binding protein [Turicibacter sp.]